MEVGVFATCTDETLRPDEVAVLVEQAELDALHFGEHTHMPASSTEAVNAPPRDWSRMPDLLIALNTAAQATTRLRVSSGIIQLGHREPIVTAKAIATIDFLSGGRLDLIVGHGTIPEQTGNHGFDFETRYELVRERMLAMREIWRNDEATFHGDFVNFDRILSWPKPTHGVVPLYYGGNSPGSEDNARAYGDGWAPLALAGTTERIRIFKEDAQSLPVIAVGVPADPGAITEYAEAGTDRLVFRLGSVATRSDVEQTLEDIRAAVSTAVG